MYDDDLKINKNSTRYRVRDAKNSITNYFANDTKYSGYKLTDSPLLPHVYVSESGQHWFRQWLVAYSAPSHYLNQCWNTKLFIDENASENIVYEMAAI